MITEGAITGIIRAWPAQSRAVAEHMMHYYRLPQVATDSLLMWTYNSPWKKSVVYREGIPHHFPVHHTDVLEQVVDYRVSLAKAQELSEFNGSLIISRTRGELTAWCENEALNCMILNLANDIAIGHKTVEEARRKQAEMVMALRLNWPVEYAEELRFQPSSREGDYVAFNTGDPDVSNIKKGIAEMGRDVVHEAQRVLRP